MNKREVIIGATLFFGGVIGFAVKPSKRKGPSLNLGKAVSNSFGDWTRIERGIDSVPQPSNYTQSIYEQVIVGHFASSAGQVVTVLIAYNGAQSYASQLHRPDICYPASGFQILHHKDIEANLSGRNIQGRILDTKRGAREETVLFWTRIGTKYPRSLRQQRLEIFRAALSQRKKDGVVVRASTPTSETGDSGEVLIRFAKEFVKQLSNEHVEILIGPGL